MKKCFIISTSFLLLLTACTKDISRFNEQTKSPSNVPPSTLFSNAVRTLTDGLASANVNTNVYRLVVQHWATTTYQDEPNYDFTTRNIPQGWWSRMYRDVLVDLKEAQRLIPSDINITDEGQRKNQIAISDVMQVFTYSVLVNTF
jgi:ABC-type Fe3+-hydroxamate transport system substrate-binding protein